MRRLVELSKLHSSRFERRAARGSEVSGSSKTILETRRQPLVDPL